MRSPPEYNETLNSKFKTAIADLKLYRGTGGFIISEIAADAVERLLNQLESEAQDPSIDTCEMNLEAIAKCRQIVMIEARAALKLDD